MSTTMTSSKGRTSCLTYCSCPRNFSASGVPRAANCFAMFPPTPPLPPMTATRLPLGAGFCRQSQFRSKGKWRGAHLICQLIEYQWRGLNNKRLVGASWDDNGGRRTWGRMAKAISNISASGVERCYSSCTNSKVLC